MNKIAALEQMSPFEKLLVGVDTPPWDAVFRVVIGFTAIPMMSRAWRGDPSDWALVPFLLGVLLLLRLIPAVVRKLLPFSARVREAWFQQRRVAKRYDSYQWKKLFWVGLGLASYILFSGQFLIVRIVVASICLLSGALGLARWRALNSQMNSARTPANQVRDSA
jgi:predicted small integral membrane protein